MNTPDLALPPSLPDPPSPLAIVEAAVERVVRRHEATLATLRETIPIAAAGVTLAPQGAVVYESVVASALLAARDREIAHLTAELARAKACVVAETPSYLRDEIDRARQLLARAETTIRAQGREIERLAAELARRS